MRNNRGFPPLSRMRRWSQARITSGDEGSAEPDTSKLCRGGCGGPGSTGRRPSVRPSWRTVLAQETPPGAVFLRNSQSTPSMGRFSCISAGWEHTCGLKADGSIACWGDDYKGEATPPGDRFASVSAGWSHSCGVRDDGTVACWGDNEDGQATSPEGRHISVSAGLSQTCG